MKKKLIGRVLTGFIAIIPLVGIIQIGIYFNALFRSMFGFAVPREILVKGIDLEPVVTFLVGLIFCYLIGWALTTVAGKLILKKAHNILAKLPILGSAYESIMDTLGLSHKGQSVLKKPVLVTVCDSQEIGFISKESHAFAEPGKVAVYIPGVPIPANGRLVFVDRERDIKELEVDNKAALHAIFTIGNDEIFHAIQENTKA